MLGSIVLHLASPTTCVLTLLVHLHLFTILICHSPITNKFFFLINVLLKFMFTDSLSTLPSQTRCNLFSSTVLSWQGIGGGQFNTGRSCYGWITGWTDQWHAEWDGELLLVSSKARLKMDLTHTHSLSLCCYPHQRSCIVSTKCGTCLLKSAALTLISALVCVCACVLELCSGRLKKIFPWLQMYCSE